VEAEPWRFILFPNYIWNLSVAIALESGGQIGEIVDMCQPIKDAAAGGRRGHAAFMKPMGGHGRQAGGTGRRGRGQGRAFSASAKLERASLYLFVAERMQGHGAPGRKETYAKARDAFDRPPRWARSTASGWKSR
jgi:hypothetical protein